MLRTFIMISVMICLFHISDAQRNKKFFRKDYHYLEKPQSFYKIHTLPKNWENAKKTCKLEGATLFYPFNEAEANSVIQYWNETQPYNWVFIGISARFAKGSFASIEGYCHVECGIYNYSTDRGGSPGTSRIVRKFLLWSSNHASLLRSIAEFGELIFERQVLIWEDKKVTECVPYMHAPYLKDDELSGLPIDDVYNKWAPWEPNDAGGVEDCVVLSKLDTSLNDDNCDKKLPFICKKTLASLEWNEKCSVPDIGYKYNKELSKCYKLHLTPMNWSEAYSVCSSEQSYLAIINNQCEADFFSKLIKEAPKDNILLPYLLGAMHLGFQNLNGEGWSTIKGDSLEETGYMKWGSQQPDGGFEERCGSMFYEGTLNDIGCQHKCLFVCERETIDGVDNRFGSLQ